MVIFDKKEIKDNKIIYEVATDKLEDQSEEANKFCFTRVIINALIEDHPDKEEALEEVYAYVNNLLEESYHNAENLLMVKGMNIILSKLDQVLSSDKD